MSAPRLSIIVPVRNEAAAIAGTLLGLREPGVREIIVVDGASADDTRSVARLHADQVLESPPGRALQMNAGARAAIGDLFFFLHADTRVPRGFARAILAAFEDPAVVGGRFDVELDAPGAAYRLISTLINLRSRWSGLFTGDQGLFVRREIFEALGGFPPEPLLEDLAFSIALRRTGGRVACLRERVRTSARRWRTHGIARTVGLMWTIRALYFFGVSPTRLSRLYRDVR